MRVNTSDWSCLATFKIVRVASCDASPAFGLLQLVTTMLVPYNQLMSVLLLWQVGLRGSSAPGWQVTTRRLIRLASRS